MFAHNIRNRAENSDHGGGHCQQQIAGEDDAHTTQKRYQCKCADPGRRTPRPLSLTAFTFGADQKADGQCASQARNAGSPMEMRGDATTAAGPNAVMPGQFYAVLQS